MRILIVEDEYSLADAVTAVLKKEQYFVDAVYDGRDGLDYALSDIYDLILLDIMLPKMNGLDVLKEIRKNNISTPVMLLTAKSEVDDKIKGLDCAHCAQKLEGLIANIEGVKSSKLNFTLQKLKVELEDENSEAIIEKVFDIVDDFGDGEVSLKEL